MQLLYLNFTQEQCTTHLTVHVITEDLFISEIINSNFILMEDIYEKIQHDIFGNRYFDFYCL